MFVQTCSYKTSFKTVEKESHASDWKGLQDVSTLNYCPVMVSDQIVHSFIQLGLENFQAWRLHDLSGQPTPLLHCLHGEKVSPISSWSLSFQFMPTVSHLPATHLWKAWLYPLINLFVGIWRLLWGPPKAFSSPGWRSPIPSASPHRLSTPAPWPSLLNLLKFTNVCLVLNTS